MGAALATAGYQRKNRGLTVAGLGMLARGVSGFCPVSAMIGRDTASHDTREALGGARGVSVEDAIRIDRPADEVYAFWRQLENLPRFMSHVEEVREAGGNLSHWVARGPLGVTVEWDAEIINDVPGSLISWKSVGDSDVVSAGSVRFMPVGDDTTEVHVKLQYSPPAGKFGATVAWLFGEDPQHQIAEDLRHFKQLLETGEVRRSVHSRPASRMHPRRDAEAAQMMTDPFAAL
jgi:uncharacterized membrane protein